MNVVATCWYWVGPGPNPSGVGSSHESSCHASVPKEPGLGFTNNNSTSEQVGGVQEGEVSWKQSTGNVLGAVQ